jgi:NlpC/P60 family putative phage cell wall peptidase
MSGERIIAAARGWLGTPYRHQASLRGVGCDCLGLMRGVWREVYGAEPETPPPYSPDWAENAAFDGPPSDALIAAAARHLRPVPEAAMRPGDILIFRWRPHLPAKHLAILSAPGWMIHAHDGACVCEAPFSPWWRRHLAAVFRCPEATP